MTYGKPSKSSLICMTTDKNTITHVALIFGGPSAEHEVSLCSAKNIYEVLRDVSFQVSLLAVTKKGVWRLIKGKDLEKTDFQNPLLVDHCGLDVELISQESGVFIYSKEKQKKIGDPFDCIFPIIHGSFGEDGKLQSLLKKLNLAFVGSDTLGCENAYDKVKTKELINQTGVPQTPFMSFLDCEPDFDQLISRLGLPFFIKPAHTGSSIGVSKVMNKESFSRAFLKAREHDKKILVEKAVFGRELECAVLEDGKGGLKVTGLGEVKASSQYGFYSYEAKYLDPQGAELIIPAQVQANVVKKIQDYAVICFKKLGCRHYARVDFFLSDKGEIFFNEINTHPGFTNISQFPLLWKNEGLDYKELILKLIKGAVSGKRIYS